MKNIIFTLIFLATALFGITNKLLDSKNTTIIDIGYNPAQATYKDIFIPQEWLSVAADIREVNKVIFEKERNITKYDCETDFLGHTNCPAKMVSCDGTYTYKKAIANSKTNTITTNKICLGVISDGKCYKDSNNDGIPDTKNAEKTAIFKNDKLTYWKTYVFDGHGWIGRSGGDVKYTVSGTDLLFWHGGKPEDGINNKLFYNVKDNKWSMTGDGRGEGIFLQDTTLDIVDNCIKFNPLGTSLCVNKTDERFELKDSNGNIVTDINVSFKKGSWHKISRLSNRNNVIYMALKNYNDGDWSYSNAGFKVEFSCPANTKASGEICVSTDVLPFSCPIGYTDKNGICTKTYSYSNYTCSTDMNNYGYGWGQPLISATSDCDNVEDGGTCPENNPIRNCRQLNYTCPFNKTKTCSFSGDEVETNIFNNIKYIPGTSILKEKSIVVSKECIDGGIYNQQTNKCEKPSDNICRKNGFKFSNDLNACYKEVKCDGFIDQNGFCNTEAEHSCKIGYNYNKIRKKCEKTPSCEEGTYDTISNQCVYTNDNICTPPFSYNSSTKRCEAPLTKYEKICPSSTMVFNAGRCIEEADLSSWSSAGAGKWTYDKETKLLLQSENGPPTFYISKDNYENVAIEGKMKVFIPNPKPANYFIDDDLIGLVFSWQNSSNYYAFDWKKEDQGSRNEGLWFFKVNNEITDFNDWLNESYNKTILSRKDGKNGSIKQNGWIYDKWYTIKMEYKNNKIVFYIDGINVLEYENDSIKDLKMGKVGFLNMSQSHVYYKDFKIDASPICPIVNGIQSIEDKSDNRCYLIPEEGTTANLVLGIYYKIPVCKNGTWNNNEKRCEVDPVCSDDGVLDFNIDLCQIPSNDTCSQGETRISSDKISTTNYICKKNTICPEETNPSILKNKPICQYTPTKECPFNYFKENGKCVSTPYCPDGLIETKTACKKDYTYYKYECPADYVNQKDEGFDCFGNCGNNECQCNSNTPPADNCYKTVGLNNNNLEIITKRALIKHAVIGSLSETEYGKTRNLTCGPNCTFGVNKIYGKNNKLCFEKISGDNSCLTFDSCFFSGEINNNDEVINYIDVLNENTLVFNGQEIKSNCKLIGQVGWPGRSESIVSVKTNDNKILFWDSFVDQYIGDITIIKDVKSKDKKDGFIPENIIPYNMLNKGFTNVKQIGDRTIFIYNKKISTGECTNKAKLNKMTNALYLTNEIKNKLKIELNSKNCFLIAGGQNDFNSQNFAIRKKLLADSTAVLKCSPLECVDNQCITADCLPGYDGKITNIEASGCQEQECDGTKEFYKYCGLEGGCKNQKNIFEDNDKCYEYYCEDLESIFDKNTLKCKKLGCPENTTFVNGSCKRN
jgi:hypothetical protein